MLDHPTQSVGRMVAQTLAGSWRTLPPPLQLERSDLTWIVPQLLASGVAGLAWRRLRGSDLDDAAAQLRTHYKESAVQSVLQRHRIELMIQALHAAGIKPMLVKGWAAARLYPDEGLRPYVDVDICIQRHQFASARDVLKTLPDRELTVDLHYEFATLGGGAWEEVYSRGQIATLGEVEVRVPGEEDHLRILSIHMLREGAWRPLWLCDVAAAVESRRSNFDWQTCLGTSRQAPNWIICALKLANQLLDADISHTPAADDTKALPQWLTRTVLKEWGTPAPSMTLRHQAPMARQLRSGAVVSGFRHRWPNAIEGTIVSGGLFNDLPRLPFQLTAYIKRGAHFAFGLPRARRAR